jgi:hypothetical protein
MTTKITNYYLLLGLVISGPIKSKNGRQNGSIKVQKRLYQITKSALSKLLKVQGITQYYNIPI